MKKALPQLSSLRGFVNRGDMTPIELFLAAFADWSSTVRRLLGEGGPSEAVLDA